ncbi:MAG: YdcF family protein [Bryobacteraceae bacterium]
MWRLAWKTAAAATAAIAGVVAYVSVEVERQATRDEARPADVILVLGAAEYRGRPSPVLKARLDHALALYRKHLAPRILTTGGSGGDPDFTEGGVGRAYLIEHQVPAEAILVEPESESTAHSAVAVAEIMQRMNLRSCIVVSDGYHIFRAKRMLESRGIEAYGSPRPSPGGNGWWQYLRQAAGYVVWRVGLQ